MKAGFGSSTKTNILPSNTFIHNCVKKTVSLMSKCTHTHVIKYTQSYNFRPKTNTNISLHSLLAHVKNNNIPNNNRSNSAIWFPVFITGSKWLNVKPSKQAKTSYNKHGKKILSLLVCSDIVINRYTEATTHKEAHTHQNNGLGFCCWIKHIAE